ncbi:MAG: response regulator transcription factor [Candidatus Xenobiia bacterium LiM19]
MKGGIVTSRILIVDDEAHIRLLLEQALEDLEEKGVELLTAPNGEEALKIIEAEKPELVFLDVMMPKMNGLDVCNAVKNTLRMKDVFIIMVTAKGQEIEKVQGRQAGADMYMTKPFDPDEVYEKAVEILKLGD